MVEGQMVSQTELESADAKTRDELFQKAYKITDEELEQVRSAPTRYERMVSAAQLLFFRSGDPKQLTSYNVAAIAAPGKEWKGTKTMVDYSCVLSNELKHEKTTREAASGLKMSSVQVLRDMIGAYDGNLEEAAQVWGGKITPSNADWLRSITIPQEIDYATSQFIGMLWGDGEYSRVNSEDGMRMSGRGCDKELYDNVVSEAAKMLFNLDSPVKTIETKQSVSLSGVKYDQTRHSVYLNSKAVSTWIVECLGFPKHGEEFSLPKVEHDKQAFLEGLFASRGMVHRLHGQGSGRGICDMISYEIASHDDRFMDAVEGLLKELGYSPKRYKNKKDGVNHLHIGRNADKERIELINPRHRKTVEETERYNQPDPDNPIMSYDEARSLLAEGLTSRQIFETFNVDPEILANASISNGKKRQFEKARAAEAEAC
jgi:hypothetical protein